MDDDTRGSRLAEVLEKAQARGCCTTRGSATTSAKSFREGQLHTRRAGTVEAPPRIKARHRPIVNKEQRQARVGTLLPAPVKLPAAGTHISVSCEAPAPAMEWPKGKISETAGVRL